MENFIQIKLPKDIVALMNNGDNHDAVESVLNDLDSKKGVVIRETGRDTPMTRYISGLSDRLSISKSPRSTFGYTIKSRGDTTSLFVYRR